jgi:tetratricopeptide (TPR) repeat protein
MSLPASWRLALTTTLLLLASAAMADDAADCRQTADRDLQIGACTEVILAKGSVDDSVNAYAERGKAYLAQSKYEKAVADFTEVLHLDPKMTTSALRMRASAYIGEEDWSVAMADLNLAVKLAPDEAETFVVRSKAYRQKGDVGGADADCGRAHALDPSAAC